MTTHTPGPWKVDDESAPSMAGVFARVGGDPFNGYMGIPISAESLAPHRVVSALSTEMRANARLIAAAPEMLALVQRVADMRTALHTTKHPEGACMSCDAGALLARIEGEKP